MIEHIQSGTDDAVASINEGSRKVGEGVALAGKARDSMARITTQADQVVSAVGGIAATLREQSSAGGQIEKEVAKISDMAERNRREVADIADAAKRVERISGELQEAVASFRV